MKILFIFLSIVISVYADDDNATTIAIIDLTGDVVGNYFLSIFIYYTAIITPFFVAFGLITKNMK